MKKAYSYQRWSTILQGKAGKDSATRQTDSAKIWLKDYGKDYELAETFVDAGKSGFKGKHIGKNEDGTAKGELERFLQLVEAGTISKGSILLIDDFSRFSRLQPTDSLALFMRVISAGIGLVFTGSFDKRIINRDLINKDGSILLLIIGEMIRSYGESAEKSRKVKSALKAKYDKLKAGLIIPHNNVPKYLSYDAKTNTYQHNANTVLVQQMARDYLAGNSLYAIVKKFNNDKIPTFRRGFQWSSKSAKCILANTVLIGEFLGNKQFCKPMITREDYDTIQLRLNSGEYSVQGREGVNLVNIFRGMAVCSECGKRMHVTTQKFAAKKAVKVPYRYFRCSSSSTGQNCTNRNYVKMSDVEIEFFVEFLMKTPGELGQVNNDQVKRINASMAETTQKKLGIDNQIAKLVEVQAEVELDQLVIKLKQLKAESEDLKRQLDSMSNALRAVQSAPVDFGDVRKIVMGVDGFQDTFNAYTSIVKHVTDSLQNNEIRKKVSKLLPTLIGKIKVYTQVGSFGAFEVLDRQGKVIYKSMTFNV